MTVQENLEMGAYHPAEGRDRRRTSNDVYQPLPPPEGAPQAGRRHPVRRRAADAGHGPRADVATPKLLMLDEPSMGLAPILVEQIFDIIQELHAAGTTILLVEQNAQHGAVHRPPRLCAGNRQHRDSPAPAKSC